MTRPELASHPAFARILKTLLADGSADPLPPAGGRRAFGSGTLRVGGKIFAMEVQGRVVLKLPAPRVDAPVAAGRCARFENGSGRAMKEWVALEGAARGWLALAREAQAYVGGAR